MANKNEKWNNKVNSDNNKSESSSGNVRTSTEKFDSTTDVKNLMPPPPNPNRDKDRDES
jgi:hypothetical protein